MIHIAAFRPLRYNPDRISFVSRVVAPPYDLIDADAADELRARDPHNVVRLTLGKEDGQDHSEEDYRRAAALLQKWRRQDVLVREPVPSVYVCEQCFELSGRELVRRGLICTVLLEDPSGGNVLPHEQTTPEAKADRLRLMEVCRASLSPVFGVFSDQTGQVDRLLHDLETEAPLYEFGLPDGIGYKVWRVSNREALGALAAVLAEENLLIADGHHRYETALAYRERHRQGEGPPGSQPEDFLLTFGVSAKNDGLVVLPTHRLARSPEEFYADRLVTTLQQYFTVEERSVGGPKELAELAGGWTAGEPLIGVYLGRGRLLLLDTDRHDLPSTVVSPDQGERARLPVTVLQYGILEPLFDIPAQSRSYSGRLRYEPNPREVHRFVESGQFDAGFLLPPVDPLAVERVARSGQTMPPKTTFFYPKVPSGLVLYPFENSSTQPVVLEPR